MRLLIDAGNTRMKWQLLARGKVLEKGFARLEEGGNFHELAPWNASIERIVISTVIAEERRRQLKSRLEATFSAPVIFHWAESRRGKLVNAYSDVSRMGGRSLACHVWWLAGDRGRRFCGCGRRQCHYR